MSVLSTARSMQYEVGSNLKGHGIGATWPLVLPSLEIDTAVVVGSASSAELEALRSLTARTLVIDRPNASTGDLNLGRHRLDLVVLGRGADRVLGQVPVLRDVLMGHLSPRGAIYGERRGRRPGPLSAFGEPSQSLTVMPARGPARVFVPASDTRTVDRLAALGFVPPRGNQGRLLRMINRMAAAGPLREATQRYAELVVGPGGGSSGPPAYVTDIAAEAGHMIATSPWAVVAPGDYASQKVLVMLFDGVERRPWTIVKLSRDPAHAGRLRNEAAALRRLSDLGLAGASVPLLRFSGMHAGRGIVGQSWLEGRPFGEATDPTLESEALSAATNWLMALAVATVERQDSGDVGAALRDLFVRFQAIYGLPPDEAGFLESQVRTIETHIGALPVVMQHGDPGTWNLLVGESGEVAVLDWESAEVSGIPLWDLVHFQRSYGALAARRAGVRRRVDASIHNLVVASPLNARFAEDIARLAAAVDLPSSLIEPVFFTCWMHRALKESTRRMPTTLHRGFYLRLLRQLIRQRDSEGVRRLVARRP